MAPVLGPFCTHTLRRHSCIPAKAQGLPGRWDERQAMALPLLSLGLMGSA